MNGREIEYIVFVTVAQSQGGRGEVLPKLHTNLDVEAIRGLRTRHPHVLHVAAIGGWNGPHPPPGPSGHAWCRCAACYMLCAVHHGWALYALSLSHRYLPSGSFRASAND